MMISIMNVIWKIGFFGAILFAIAHFILSSQSIEFPLNFKKPISIFIFFSLWSYALYKTVKTKGVMKKICLLLISLVFSVIAGWVLYFYDNYSANRDIKT